MFSALEERERERESERGERDRGGGYIDGERRGYKNVTSIRGSKEFRAVRGLVPPVRSEPGGRSTVQNILVNLQQL